MSRKMSLKSDVSASTGMTGDSERSWRRRACQEDRTYTRRTNKVLFGRRAKRISLLKDRDISLKKEERPHDVETCEAEANRCLLRLRKTNQHAVPMHQSEEPMFCSGNSLKPQ